MRRRRRRRKNRIAFSDVPPQAKLCFSPQVLCELYEMQAMRCLERAAELFQA